MMTWFLEQQPVIQALLATLFTWGVTKIRCRHCLLFSKEFIKGFSTGC
ncbi:hypothetical protein MGH68_09975 [Erysipelothrix sp. D19-032]